MKKIYETLMAAGESISWASSGKRRGFVVFSVFFLVFLFGGNMTAKAALGLNREAYGVWDREGGHSVSTYPYTRGQEYQAEWTEVHTARSNYNWTAMDALLQTAYDQNQRFFVKIQPISATTMPPWIFSAGVPQIVCPLYTYGYYLDPEFKIYFAEMVAALGKHLREEVPAHLADIVSFVRVDTGCTGDEGPYENTDVASVPSQYQISLEDWRDYRIWVFGLYDQAFQHGTGSEIPLIFQDIETPAFAIEQGWVRTNVTSGFGAKYGGQVRGHHLSESRNVPDSYKAYSMDTPMKFFSANEMDQTWEKFYFQLNLPIGFYWCAAESLNAGLSIQDWSGSAIEGAAANNFEFAATLFNTWAAELDPPTARGGFCIFHEGLDSANTNKFPEATFGSPAKMSNTARYTAICAAYASQGAKMDHLIAATWGQVAQRRDQNGFNDAGWEIWPGNYERFITQINPDNTSKGLWRVRGTLTTSSNPYDRFARRFDSASGWNTMYFDVNDNLTPTPGQSIKLSVVYLDAGTGQFGLLYDAVGNSQKSAFTVTKSNSNNWKTNTVTVTDWVFGNNGPNGADLMLTSVDSNDDTFSRIELVKLVNVTMNTVGSGTVTARNDFTVYSPVSGTYATGQRLDMTVTPASGWSFSGWSGGLSGSNSRAILFPTNVNTTVTATFVNTGATSATDDFETGTWTGGTGWTGGWSTSGGALVDTDSSLAAHLTANGQITRVAATPIVTGGQLAFNWHIKSLEAGESAQAEIYDGSWRVVWTKASLVEESGATNINLGAYSNISQVRFTVNAPGGADHFWVDNVTLSGTAAVNPTYTLTVNSGTGDGSYTNGAKVAISADAPAVGKAFDRWTGSTQYVNNVTYTNALVTMSTNAVTLTATYVDVYYPLTVNSGSGSGSYTNGTVVAVTASNAPSGKVFDQWTGSGAQYLANASSASTTVTMPAQAISLTATYVDVYYTLTVNSGSGDGSYTNGTQVEITADAPAVGKAFDKWIGDTQYLAGATVTMPATNVTLTATYVDVYYALTVNSGSGDGSYTNGTQVAIAADVIVQKIFAAWTGDTQYVASVTASNTTVTMPAQAVVLTATYTDSAVYHLLTTSTGANGTIAPTNASVLAGDSTNFVITASNYYRIATLTTNGAAVTGMTFDNNSTTTNFIWSNVQTSGVLAATFTAQVTTNAPANVPYEWLAGYGLTNYNTDSTTDVDLDGLTAWQEYITGTDPANTTSGFKAAQATRNTVTWSPVSGRVYSVYWSTNLVNGFQPLETNILYPQGSYTNLNAGPRVNLYQIKVRMQ